MQFEDKIRNIIEKECEDYFLGTADLSHAKDPMISQYYSLINEYPRAISIGITLPHIDTNSLLNKTAKIYRETNCKLKSITTHLSNLLELNGYKAIAVPKSKIMDNQTFISLHKLVANQANLGQIKENGLLVTSEAGSLVNWGTVLTDAFL